MNSRGMAMMANQFPLPSNVHDVFLLRKMDINCESKNKIQINHLKMLKDLNVISPNKFRQKLGLFWNCTEHVDVKTL